MLPDRFLGAVSGRTSPPSSQLGSLGPSDGSKEPEPTTTPTVTPVPILPEVEEPKKEPIKEVEPPAPVKKRHVMTLINGSSREKAVFVEGDTEDEEGSSTPPAKKVEKSVVKKSKPQPATPVAPTTKTPQNRGR